MTVKTALCVFIPLFVLLFCYQNCQKPPYADEIVQPIINVQNSNSDQKVIAEIDQTEIQNLVFTERMPVQMNHSGKAYTLLDLVKFSIDWQSGVIQEVTSQNQLMAKYCLTQEALDGLKGLLVAGQVCEFRQQQAAQQVCSQIVVPGYVKLITSNGDVDVGSQSDSCGTQRIEFCDDRGEVLKEWFSKLKVNLANLSCS
jgi:hypothetical protein